MNPDYFETRFQTNAPAIDDWPAQFAILTAYATTGETWTAAENEAADRALEARLRGRNAFLRRITGYSPRTGHAEPGWAADIGWEEACALGEAFKQDAIYFVTGDELWVTHCDPPLRELVPVGLFRERLRHAE